MNRKVFSRTYVIRTIFFLREIIANNIRDLITVKFTQIRSYISLVEKTFDIIYMIFVEFLVCN